MNEQELTKLQQDVSKMIEDEVQKIYDAGIEEGKAQDQRERMEKCI